jgi:hypothetical protein
MRAHTTSYMTPRGTLSSYGSNTFAYMSFSRKRPVSGCLDTANVISEADCVRQCLGPCDPPRALSQWIL